VSFKPGDLGDQEHLDAELRLRDGLGHPDLAPLIDDDRGLHMAERESERVLWISGSIDPDHAEEVEAAVWDRMHFASHLRSERLGEFTVGTELRRSQSLAIVQVLVLYHLVTGHATVALGGEGPRVVAASHA
jgi:phosphoribulokinase